MRILSSLNKIRDEIALALRGIGDRVNRLNVRGDRLLAARPKDSQRTHLDIQDRFARELKGARRLESMLDELTSLVRQSEGADKR